MTAEALAARLGHRFARPELLAAALRHSSWVAEHGGESNERLEFLGDAVLDWVVADMVFARHEGVDEGRLTDLRKSVVNAQSLAALASEIGLGDHLLLGKGEDAEGGRRKVSILSDALEAVLGALYLDAGPAEARRIVGSLLEAPVAAAMGSLDRLDPKTRLQELAARGGHGAVEYAVTGEGPDHAKVFTATVTVGGAVSGTGTGPTKKAAEQAAADVACESLRDGDDR